MDVTRSRYAVYFAPDEKGRPGRFGRLWLGRTARKMEDGKPGADLTEAQYQKIINAPKHYGFHGTLKAPFELHSDYKFHDLDAALTEFSLRFPAFAIKSFELETIGDFIALVPGEEPKQLRQLHTRLTEEFNQLNAPLSDYDRERFLARGLSGREEEYLFRYSYPFVLDAFKFHLTLTGNLAEDEKNACFRLLGKMTASFRDEGLCVDRISLFQQQTRNDPFFMIKDYRLRGES
ncbi:DUF1045 domain-containing protein [Desulfocicer vacuolatum]|uniref:DUF1045 domain-containing protein n=1 Tax=Desulfocicer vacuolatum TaxID=2298 RepID=UPI001BB078CC|nr:DUF1045 domain-containing protein [Desulfocicer vacuolatum]